MIPAPDIRRARATDLPAILALLENAGLPTADIASIDKPQMWVLEERDAIVGAIALERFGSEALLRSLVIAPDHRKRGFGRELVARVEQSARADRVNHLVLLTETAESFFRRLGYRAIDRSSVSNSVKQSAELRSLCPDSASCMSKILAKPSWEGP
jgi:N-acetylglutamate synthase-like GNAT family acetyltransferase